MRLWSLPHGSILIGVPLTSSLIVEPANGTVTTSVVADGTSPAFAKVLVLQFEGGNKIVGNEFPAYTAASNWSTGCSAGHGL